MFAIWPLLAFRRLRRTNAWPAFQPLALVLVLLSGGSFALLGSNNQQAFADDLVIDNVRGSDYQNDRGYAPGPATHGPYRTIARALAVAGPGDRIVLTKTDQPYRECVSLNGDKLSGTSTEPLILIGNGATLDGSEATNPIGWRTVPQEQGLWEYVDTPPGFGLLLSSNQTLGQWKPKSEQGNLSLIGTNTWTRQQGRFLFRPAPGKGPRDYHLQMTVQTTGITLYDIQHVQIQDLTIRGFRIDGINALDRATHIKLSNVTVIDNGRSGISVGGASHVTVDSSEVSDNGIAQLRTEGNGVLELGRVIVDPSTAPAIVDDGGRVVGRTTPPAK